MTQLHSAAAHTLAQWHQMVAQRDLSGLAALIDEQAVFRSPMAFKPYLGSTAMQMVLHTVITVFEDFNYHREFVSAEGESVVLEFSARVGDKQLKGIDMLRFNQQGKIIEFEVMIRPFSALQALGQEMAQKLAPLMAAYQGVQA